MIYDAIIDLVGEIPSGMENFVYVISCVILVFLLLGTFTFLSSVLKRLMEI